MWFGLESVEGSIEKFLRWSEQYVKTTPLPFTGYVNLKVWETKGRVLPPCPAAGVSTTPSTHQESHQDPEAQKQGKSPKGIE